ncbi:MAG TPA: radical SAM protein [Candidatus Aenigmarchaeota archaeon]|nr:MAG: radical SAM/SPASM domain-containing protein [Candidatus Aenigmarchaeota archaeon]HDD46016.1 radical SAM protein [Candidatus Aenigmarchaeota archaeon]
MKETEIVVESVERWLSNPLSRAMLKWVTKRSNGRSKLERALKKYAGMDIKLNLSETITYYIASFILNKSSSILSIEKERFKEALKENIVRRGIVNILEGIAYYGVRRPQITAAPFLIVWNLTRQCNLRCKHCYENATSTAGKDELTTDEAKQAIDEFANAGVVAVAFSGGEPLLRKDFFEIANYAKQREFYVSLATNGTLITKDVARKLKRVVDYVEISLDGFEEVHDRFRGVEGAWKRSVAGIKNCVNAGIDTCVATTVTKYNLSSIPRLLEFVEKELKANRFIVFNYVPAGRGKGIVEHDITPEEREKLLAFLYSKLISKSCMLDVFSTAPQYAVTAVRSGSESIVATHFTNKAAMDMLKGRAKALAEFIGGCGAGRLYCGLEPNGDVEPCVFIPIKLGNIREKSLVEIWHNSEILDKIRKREEFEGCGECKYRYICGGCRARAYGYFNDLQAPDPGCTINKKYWEKCKAQPT